MTYVTDGMRHLICIPYSVENLHDMAKDLGIKRCWFHGDHYDIPKRRIEEIEAKCIMISPFELVTYIPTRQSYVAGKEQNFNSKGVK